MSKPSRMISPPCRLAALAVLLLTAACSRDNDAEDRSARGGEAPSADTVAQPTIGGDGSPILLSPLSPAEIEAARLPGELGCGFSGPSGAPLLVAMGDVASPGPATGVVKVASFVETVAAPGGFDAMVKGVTFTGAGKTIRIELRGSPIGGGEAPPIPARLIYERADGASRTFTGLWECGP